MMNQEKFPALPDICKLRAGQQAAKGALLSLGERQATCDLCGILFAREELRQFGPFTLCPDCGAIYCDACFQEYGDAFIEENAHTFYTGWFEGLSAEEQLHALQDAYRACYRQSDRVGRARMRAERREFCSACVNEAWPIYVAKRLNSAYNTLFS